jgi:hypothetical protein
MTRKHLIVAWLAAGIRMARNAKRRFRATFESGGKAVEQ